MKVLKILLILVLLPLLYVAVNILYGTLTDYRPPDEEEVATATNGDRDVTSDSLNLYIWNIGYAGLGRESDFFLDGGKMTRSSRALTEKNYNGIKQEIGRWGDADFILLQEVDEDAKRSYGTDQFRGIGAELGGGITSALGYNYVVKFVPVPYFKPLGRVKAGLATYTPYAPSSVMRYQFPGNFAWPKRIYFLDRCFLVMRFPYRDRELLVINTHNSAYDDGSLKAGQMEYLKKIHYRRIRKGELRNRRGRLEPVPAGLRLLRRLFGRFHRIRAVQYRGIVHARRMDLGLRWRSQDQPQAGSAL